MKKLRVDQLLVSRGLVETRNLAQRLIMAGQVRADGEIVFKSSQKVDESSELTVASLPRYVSRGGEKLQAALDTFGLEIKDLICADVGASTGGFTDCLLQYGAARVYAIDVGKGLLHWRLRQDPRVSVIEGVNARQPFELPEAIDLATIDVSFISVKLILPSVRRLIKSEGHLICLVKPQFEAGKEQVGRGGLVRDPEVHRSVLRQVADAMSTHDFRPQGLIASPITGPKRNVEFLLWCTPHGKSVDLEQLIEKALSGT
jgi:23S rRNA (cytidine1920-2'-O)/16S rRNA (cytidine1409-2'-O)-methyltransferase